MIDDLRVEDVSESYRDIVDVVGLDNFVKLVKSFGGMSIYIPVEKSITRASRDRKIRAGFEGDYRKVAMEFRLSKKQVRKIVDSKN